MIARALVAAVRGLRFVGAVCDKTADVIDPQHGRDADLWREINRLKTEVGHSIVQLAQLPRGGHCVDDTRCPMCASALLLIRQGVVIDDFARDIYRCPTCGNVNIKNVRAA